MKSHCIPRYSGIRTCLLVACLSVAAGVATVRAQAQDPVPGAAAAAWAELRTAAAEQLKSATDPEAAVRSVLAEIARFATTHAGTPEAAIALVNHAGLALQIGDDAAAEQSFTAAAAQSDDPQLTAFAESQLARLAMRPGKEPPAFAAQTLAGESIAPSSFAGRVVLLDFWATWCGPCLAELPNVQAVYREHHDAGFDIVSISLDEDKTALTGFLEKREMPWTHVFDRGLQPGASLAEKYGVNAIPFMVLIGRDGKIAGLNLRGPALAQAVTAALAGPSGKRE